jgi:hypothetical protein
MGRRN